MSKKESAAWTQFWKEFCGARAISNRAFLETQSIVNNSFDLRPVTESVQTLFEVQPDRNLDDQDITAEDHIEIEDTANLSIDQKIIVEEKIAAAPLGTLLSQGIVVTGVPSVYESALMIFQNSQPDRDEHTSSSPMPDWLAVIEQLDEAVVKNALRELDPHGVDGVNKALGCHLNVRDKNVCRVLRLLQYCFENTANGVAATLNGTERTLDINVWLKYWELCGNNKYLIRYGETSSKSHVLQGGASTRLVDFILTMNSSGDSRGIEIATGESLGAAAAGSQDAKIRKSARLAKDTACEISSIVGERMAVPWIVQMKSEAWVFAIKPMKGLGNNCRATFVGILPNPFVSDSILHAVVKGAAIMLETSNLLTIVGEKLDAKSENAACSCPTWHQWNPRRRKEK
ncbi:hypothetical protein DFS34DRAFT_593787 [Phlyctochytrium arcticum]|nr:hypothetical protein DFS34DRAFT_593787 [Phlyctochytrium arcticum]